MCAPLAGLHERPLNGAPRSRQCRLAIATRKRRDAIESRAARTGGLRSRPRRQLRAVLGAESPAAPRSQSGSRAGVSATDGAELFGNEINIRISRRLNRSNEAGAGETRACSGSRSTKSHSLSCRRRHQTEDVRNSMDDHLGVLTYARATARSSAERRICGEAGATSQRARRPLASSAHFATGDRGYLSFVEN